MSSPYEGLPLKALSWKSIGELSHGLNQPKVIPSAERLPRDWRGLAHLFGLNSRETNVLEKSNDPVGELIRRYGDRCTLTDLVTFLARIDRFDVLDDATPLIDEDVRLFSEHATREEVLVSDVVQDQLLTLDDAVRNQMGLPPQRYNAFIIFADENQQFAEQLVQTLESRGLKICVEERDLLAGVERQESVAQLISDRCDKVLVVLSNAFFNSPRLKFLASFAQAIGIGKHQRILVPIKLEPCPIPLCLSYIYHLEYFKNSTLYDFWDKLHKSILPSCELSQPLPLPEPTTAVTANGDAVEFSDNSTVSLPSVASLPSTSSSPPTKTSIKKTVIDRLQKFTKRKKNKPGRQEAVIG